MNHFLQAAVRLTLFVLILLFWLWALDWPVSIIADPAIAVGGVLAMVPISWLGRRLLDRDPTPRRVIQITTFVHYAVVIVAGIAVIRAIRSCQEWSGWRIPVPEEIGLGLIIVTGGASLLAVLNLAVKGLGAPFAVALSRKLAVDWLYRWTRNPMVLAVLAFGLSLGIWFQSVAFLLWVLVLFGPALLFFVKTFEERELEIRFGPSYLEYRSRTPMLLPGKRKV